MRTRELQSIADNLMLFFPFFRRLLMRDDEGRELTLLHGNEFKILMGICFKGKLSMSELGFMLGYSKSRISLLVDKLIEDGYVQREHDPADRRVIHVSVTSAGIAWLEKIDHMVKDLIKKNLSVLSDSDIGKVASLLDEMKGILSKIDSNTFPPGPLTWRC